MAGGEGMGWKGTLGIALFIPAVVGLVAPVALRAQGLGPSAGAPGRQVGR